MKPYTRKPVCVKCEGREDCIKLTWDVDPWSCAEYLVCKCLRCGHKWLMAPADREGEIK